VAPENLPELTDRFRRAIAGEAISPHVWAEMIRKDGSRVPIELSMANLVLDGRIIGRVGVARDITDRQHAEEQIRASLQERKCCSKKSTIGSRIIYKLFQAFSIYNRNISMIHPHSDVY